MRARELDWKTWIRCVCYVHSDTLVCNHISKRDAREQMREYMALQYGKNHLR